MAMHLKLVASGDNIPDFMTWSGVKELPWFWQPFHTASAAIPLALIVPGLLAFLLGYLLFRSRVTGVYFAIVTQATALILSILFVGQQGTTGGTNGITNYSTLFGMSLREPSTQRTLYFATVAALVVCYIGARLLVRSRLGRLMIAVRDDEERVRFSGYDVALIKATVFAVAAVMAGAAGALFVPQVGIISPANLGVVPSIEMVLWVAVGGRGTLVGAAVGAVVVGWARSSLSESFPETWLYALAWSSSDRSRSSPRASSALCGDSQCCRGSGCRGGTPRRRRPIRSPRRLRAVVDEVLIVRDLVVSFDGFVVLNHLDFELENGELRFLIGPNGAGKTTLMDVLSGKTRPDSGEVTFVTKEVVAHPRIDVTRTAQHKLVRLGLGRKFQTPSVYQSLTCWENLEVSLGFRSGLIALLRGLGSRQREKVASTLEQVRLIDRANVQAGALSHGERQWLEIAMLLVQEPSLLLLDEPIAGMTGRERERTGELLHELEGRHSIVVTEHDMAFVREFSRTVTVLHQGRMLAEGPVSEIQANAEVTEVYLGRSLVAAE